MAEEVEEKSDQEQRESIPSHSDLGTDYLPVGNYIMVIPLPTPTKHGKIILPDRSQVQQVEGHIVAKGSGVPETYELGDCVSWGEAYEVRLRTESDKPFALVPHSAVLLIIKRATLEKRANERKATLP